MKSALPGFVNGYITGEAFGDTGSTYAGPAAKSLAFAETSGLDATSYGPVNLVQRVENQVTASGPSQGRLTDTSTYGDNANVWGSPSQPSASPPLVPPRRPTPWPSCSSSSVPTAGSG